MIHDCRYRGTAVWYSAAVVPGLMMLLVPGSLRAIGAFDIKQFGLPRSCQVLVLALPIRAVASHVEINDIVKFRPFSSFQGHVRLRTASPGDVHSGGFFFS